MNLIPYFLMEIIIDSFVAQKRISIEVKKKRNVKNVNKYNNNNYKNVSHNLSLNLGIGYLHN